jgi:hypothetical protein
MATLHFDPVKHVYRLNGEKLISVTTVLREAKLFDYKGSDGGMAMDRGTAVHEATEHLDKGDFKKAREINPITGYVDAWEKFRADTGVEILGIEEPVYHPIYLYAGMTDRRVLWKGKEGVIDIKTGIRAPWHCIQTMAYAKTYNRPLLRFSLYVDRKGDYYLDEHKDPGDWDVFRSALAIVNWKRRNGLVKV